MLDLARDVNDPAMNLFDDDRDLRMLDEAAKPVGKQQLRGFRSHPFDW